MKLNEILNQPPLEDGEEWTIGKRRHFPDRKPPFTMFGNGGLNKLGQSMNIISVMATLTPKSIKLFEVMLRYRNKDTNEVVMKSSELESPRLIYNHLPSLVKSGLVIRIGNGRYMINPDAVIPNNYRSAKLEWNALIVGFRQDDGLSTPSEEPTHPV